MPIFILVAYTFNVSVIRTSVSKREKEKSRSIKIDHTLAPAVPKWLMDHNLSVCHAISVPLGTKI